MISNVTIFVAPYPEQKIKDGYLQRVQQIDHIFKQVQAIYIQNSEHYEHFGCKTISDNRSVIFTNPSFIQSSGFINTLCIDSKIHFILYIHSIYQYPLAQALLNKIPRHQRTVILDVHGAVPEEELFLGNKASFEKYSLLESTAVSEADYLVCVTHALYAHLAEKYKIKIGKKIVLPMSSPQDHNPRSPFKDRLEAKLHSYESEKKIIYAGGLQKWQKIDSFVHLVKSLNDFQTQASNSHEEKSTPLISFSLWTHNTQEFANQYGQLPYLNIHSGNSDVVRQQLQNSHFSFIGRDSHILNKVSCPTKMIECLCYQCIPILMYEEIGDFQSLGLQYIHYEDLLSNKFPTPSEFKEMLLKNEFVLNQLKEIQKSGEATLMNIMPAGRFPQITELQNYDFKKDVNLFVRYQVRCFFHFSIKVLYRCLRFIFFPH